MVKSSKGSPHKHRLPFFCPNCKKISGTIDDKYLSSLGICSECFVMHVESRSKPVIDLEQYAPPDGLFEGMSRKEIDSYFLSREK